MLNLILIVSFLQLQIQVSQIAKCFNFQNRGQILITERSSAFPCLLVLTERADYKIPRLSFMQGFTNTRYQAAWVRMVVPKTCRC